MSVARISGRLARPRLSGRDAERVPNSGLPLPFRLSARYYPAVLTPALCAGMAELADAVDSKSTAGDSVRVRVSLPALHRFPFSTSRSSDQEFSLPPPRLSVDKFQIVYYVVHMTFGNHARTARERRRSQNRAFSVRQVARRIGVEPAYLSKIERDQVSPPSEATIRRLAEELDEDPDVLLAMAGKVSSDLRDIILRRPRLFADVLRQLKEMPDHAILRVVREVRDGRW